MWSKVILRPWWYFGHGRKRSHRHTQWIKRICRIIDVCGLFHTAWIWDAISWRRSANDWSRIYSYGRSSQATVKGNWVNVSFRWRFYRPDHQTNSVKALKESSWSSRSGLNPTRTTPPCCNNTTLGNCLYTQRKGPMWQTQSVGPVRTAHVSVLWTVNIVSHNSAQSSSDDIPSQSVTITWMLSSRGEGESPIKSPPSISWCSSNRHPTLHLKCGQHSSIFMVYSAVRSRWHCFLKYGPTSFMLGKTYISYQTAEHGKYGPYLPCSQLLQS